MANRVFKYVLEITDEQVLNVPTGSRPLSAQMQGDQLCLWMLVDDSEPGRSMRKVFIHGTGHEVNRLVSIYSGVFVDTFQLNGGSLVFHVFMEA